LFSIIVSKTGSSDKPDSVRENWKKFRKKNNFYDGLDNKKAGLPFWQPGCLRNLPVQIHQKSSTKGPWFSFGWFGFISTVVLPRSRQIFKFLFAPVPSKPSIFNRQRWIAAGK